MIKKYWYKVKKKLLNFIANQNNINIDNNGVTAIVNEGYLHIQRAIEYVPFYNLNKDGLIVDVGGGKGTTAVMFAQKFRKAHVLVFEPLSKNFNEIVVKTSKFQNIEVVNKALGATTKSDRINVTNNINSSSLLGINKDIQEQKFKEMLNSNESETIQIAKLDDELINFKNDINILKIDTQGYELEVLKGAINTLPRVKIIVVEVANHSFYENAPMYFEIDDFLRSNGFVLNDMIPAMLKNRKLFEWDCIYLNKTVSQF